MRSSSFSRAYWIYLKTGRTSLWGSSRNSFETTIQHTYYYLFQKQGLVANKDQLLYRQNEPFQPQAIRDTLPILLGVSASDRYELEAKLRMAQRDLKISAKFIDEAKAAIDTSQQRGLNLLSEARTVGVLPSGEAGSNNGG